MPSRAKAAHRDAYLSLPMGRQKGIALIAHDNGKLDLLDWARYNVGPLRPHELFATGTTGALLHVDLGHAVTRFLSGPPGGDQQVGAGVAPADFVLSSPLTDVEYPRMVFDHSPRLGAYPGASRRGAAPPGRGERP